jgi:hypothetical protein
MTLALGNGNVQSKHSATADQSTVVFGPITQASGNIGLTICLACDNSQTTDGDEGAVTSITDGAGNVWQKALEWCNGQGAAGAGVTCSIWYLPKITNSYSSHNITVNLSNNTTRDNTSAVLSSWTFGAGNQLILEGTPATVSDDGIDPSSINVTTANIECIRLRAIASESASTTATTRTAGFTNSLGAAIPGTAGVAIRAEIKISTETSAASNPTLFAADHASIYVCFKEGVPVLGRVQAYFSG